MNRQELAKLLSNWKYPLLILALGLALLLLPSSAPEQNAEISPQEALALLLSESQGVGEARVLISDTGVVVACAGASNPAVRLDILHAVSSYTGFGSDKITILKLES
jgi:diphthamide biosynthesis methyltransferase